MCARERKRIPGDIRVKVQDVEDGLRVQRVQDVHGEVGHWIPLEVPILYKYKV